MKISMSMYVHVNHILASDTLLHTVSSPVNFEFWFPLHCTRTIARFFPFFSLLFYLFAVTVKYFSRSLFLFIFSIFLKGTYLRVGFLTTCSQGTPRYFDISSPFFSSLFRFLRFYVDEMYTCVPYTWLSLLFCPQKMIFIIICVLISAVILVAIIIGVVPRTS